MENKKICFVNSSPPNFLGGLSLYQKNLIENIDKKKYDITWIYKSYKKERSSKGNINYVGLKVKKIIFLDDLFFNHEVKKYLEKNYFDIINSHAISGYWLKNYRKKPSQKIVHTYHGLGVPYYKVLIKRFNFLKRIFLSSFLIPLGFITDRPPMKKADKIICVSDKVKKQIEKTYFPRKNVFTIRTGGEFSRFKSRNKKTSRKKLNFDPKAPYALYVAKGGYWIKGLDRAVKLSEELFKINKNFKLIVIGSDDKKVKKLINKKFIIYVKECPREIIPLYYSASDLFFCFSRYEGGAPTLVVSEAMASKCILVCSEDSNQEILKNKENSLIIKNFDYEDAKIILSTLNNDRLKRSLTSKSLKKIKTLSLENWSKKILDILLN